MTINKNGKVKSQIHLYSNPKLYEDFKESINQLNNTTGNKYGISEIIRALMLHFSNCPELQQMIISNIDGATADNKGAELWY